MGALWVETWLTLWEAVKLIAQQPQFVVSTVVNSHIRCWFIQLSLERPLTGIIEHYGKYANLVSSLHSYYIFDNQLSSYILAPLLHIKVAS